MASFVFPVLPSLPLSDSPLCFERAFFAFCCDAFVAASSSSLCSPSPFDPFAPNSTLPRLPLTPSPSHAPSQRISSPLPVFNYFLSIDFQAHCLFLPTCTDSSFHFPPTNQSPSSPSLPSHPSLLAPSPRCLAPPNFTSFSSPLLIPLYLLRLLTSLPSTQRHRRLRTPSSPIRTRRCGCLSSAPVEVRSCLSLWSSERTFLIS